ncbi:MAG: preprotein translocase subunit Sec61beta [Halobacteriota archaeon]
MSKVKAAKKAQKAGKKGGGGGKGEERGLMSSAGLMRYYDVEESAVKVSPKTIVIIGVVLGTLIIGLHIWWTIRYGIGPWT